MKYQDKLLPDKGTKKFKIVQEKEAREFMDWLNSHGHWAVIMHHSSKTNSRRIIACSVTWTTEKAENSALPDGHCQVNGEYKTVYYEQ